MSTKYIFVTGGVVSSIGKGIVAASLGRLLKNRYPVNQDIPCKLCGLNALDFQSKLVGI